MAEHNEHNSLYENSEYPSRRQAPRSGGDSSGAGRPRKKKRRRHSVIGTIFKVLGTLFLVGLCTGAILLCFGAVYIKTVIVPIADVSLNDFVLGENSVMLVKNKETGAYEELVTLASSTSSIWVDWEEIPQYMKDAAVAIEDERFYTHPGVDWKRTGKAVLDMFTGNDISGGSTITQQLIKNLTGYNETTVKRKLTEIVRALRFTQNNSKNDTLLWYLNIIPMDGKWEGVGAAAYAYFGKPVSDLTLAECASLIAITNNPSKYGPYSPAKIATESTGELWDTKQWNKWRQENVLDKMLELGMISEAECNAAKAQKLVFTRGGEDTQEQEVYTWYEETVLSDVKRDLAEKLQWSDKKINQMLSRGGLRIYTCLDPDVQAIADAIYTDRENLKYVSKKGQLLQSSITIIDNETGDVAAIVGQFDQKTGNLWTNYANTAKRQPGSSLKPLSVYSPALELGKVSPISIVDDYPYREKEDGSPWPTNSGAESYKGRSTVYRGLTDSVNTMAVRILSDLVTPQVSFDFVQDRYNIDLVEAVQVGNEIMSDIDVSPLAMGGLTYGVCTRDMAEAFATFPSNGIYRTSRTYTKITQLVDGQEVTVLENEPQSDPVIKDTTAYYMTNMLTNVLDNGTGKGHDINGQTAGGKTGTTTDNYDRWFVGFTAYYTAAVWTGYPNPERIAVTHGENPALNLWETVMEQLHEGLPNQAFPEPSGLKTVKYCMDSGMLATPYCEMDPRGSRVASSSVFPEDVPTQECPFHTADTVVRMCQDDPILNERGQESGIYHLACPDCPEDRIVEFCLPDYEREQVGGAVSTDEVYRLAAVEAQGTCTVHGDGGPGVWDPENPEDPEGPEDGPGGEEEFPGQPSLPEEPDDG